MLNPEVLRGKQTFQKVYDQGKSAGDRYVVVFYRKNGQALTRVGFVASKKVGNAVARNRARRLMKESFRHMDPLPSGYDVIFIARNTIVGKKCRDVEKSMRSVLRRTNMDKKVMK